TRAVGPRRRGGAPPGISLPRSGRPPDGARPRWGRALGYPATRGGSPWLARLARRASEMTRNSFVIAVASLVLLSALPSPAPAMDLAVGASPYSVAMGDFNGDGHLDLAVANGGSNDVSVLLGNGDGTFRTATVVQTFGTSMSPICVSVGDVNGDHKDDLAVCTVGVSAVTVLLGDGLGNFGSPQTFTFAGDPESIAIRDFNGDGKPDLAVANDDTAGTVA